MAYKLGKQIHFIKNFISIFCLFYKNLQFIIFVKY